MRHVALLSFALLVAAGPQQEPKKFDCTLKKLEVKGGGSQWIIDLTFDHTFPEKSMISVVVKMCKHEYLWQQKEFIYGPDQKTVPMPTHLTATKSTVKTSSNDVIMVPTPGVYEISWYFDPNVQAFESVKKAMGKTQFYRREFESRIVVVGEPKKMLAALRDDTDDCDKMIKWAASTMEKIEKQSDDKDWKEKAEKIFEEVEKKKLEAEKQANVSLHNATYRMIADILAELVTIGRSIKLMKEMGNGAGGGGGGGGTGEDPPSSHPDEGSDAPVIPGMDGKTLSLDRFQAHMRTCNEVRLREVFSWLTILHEHAMNDLNEAYDEAKKSAQGQKDWLKVRSRSIETNDEIEKTIKFVADAKWEETFTAVSTYALDEKGDNHYADFPAIFKDHIQALHGDHDKATPKPTSVEDSQALVKRHLEAAHKKAVEKKK